MKWLAYILAFLMLGYSMPGSLKAMTCSLTEMIEPASACCDADDRSVPLETGHDHCMTDCHCLCCAVLFIADIEVTLLPAIPPAPSRQFFLSIPVPIDFGQAIWQPPRLG